MNTQRINSSIKAIVTDIEGTTTDIQFVHKVLFPYSRAQLPQFIRTHAADDNVRQQLRLVAKEAGSPLSDEQAIAQLLAWIDADQKIAPLKTLQGMVWLSGYINQDFQGHVYADVPNKLAAWQQAGIGLYVYSSGSVQAQKLLFGYSNADDLTPLFNGYYDTAIGHKQQRSSYEYIAKDLQLPANHILFLSDSVAELNAARAAGMQTALLERDGPVAARNQHLAFSNFDEVHAAFIYNRQASSATQPTV